MKFFCIGINHKTAPVELRERLSVQAEELNERSADWLGGIALISTCNRIEFYGSADDQTSADQLVTYWGDLAQINPAEFQSAVYSYENSAAVHHLHRVAAGLESMVLGEPQILGQVTRANETAIEQQSADALLKSAFQSAIRAGKRSRTETKISRNPVSVSSIGVSLVKRNLTNPAEAEVLVVGAGEMALLAIKGLIAFGFKNITIVNRSQPKAVALAKRWGLKTAPLSDLGQLLHTADGVITATSAPEPIIVPQMLNGLNRPIRPITLVDLAVPRDVDPQCAALPQVNLFDVDALKNEVAEGLAERKKEIPQVESIIAEELDRFSAWEKESAVFPTLTALRQQAEQIRQKELAKTLKYLGDVDPDMLKHIDKLSQTLVKQLLHRPTKALRDEARNGTLNGLEESAQKLFDL